MLNEDLYNTTEQRWKYKETSIHSEKVSDISKAWNISRLKKS